MPTDRDVRQFELVGDLFCGHSLAASLHHVGLTARELQLEPFDQRLLLRAPAQLVDEGADARTWDDRVAAQRNLDGADESARAELSETKPSAPARTAASSASWSSSDATTTTTVPGARSAMRRTARMQPPEISESTRTSPAP